MNVQVAASMRLIEAARRGEPGLHIRVNIDTPRPQAAPSRPRLTKAIAEDMILEYLGTREEASIGAMRHALNVSYTTMNAAITHLVTLKKIKVVGKKPSKTHRPPLIYALVRDE